MNSFTFTDIFTNIFPFLFMLVFIFFIIVFVYSMVKGLSQMRRNNNSLDFILIRRMMVAIVSSVECI